MDFDMPDAIPDSTSDESATRTRPVRAPGGQLRDFQTNRRVLLLSALAIPIGVIGAGVAKVLLWLIAVITNLAYFQRLSSAPALPGDNHLGAWAILVPVFGALLIGLMARFGSEKIRGHGIPEALEAILLGRSLIEPKIAVLKPISSALSIGTGGPFGAEGPIVMTGGAFGSLFAQLFHLTAAERKTLLVAGAAAGMSAVFATPVAAVLLAVELLLFEWKPRSFIPVAVAAIIASLARVPLLGVGPIFPCDPHAHIGMSGIAMSCVVGLLAGVASGGLTLLVYGVEDRFEHVRLHWMWWPAIGALVVGLGGLVDPRVLGVGYETIHGLVRGDILGATLIALLVTKGVVWTVALGSGTSGGVLAPLLILGGALGALVGQVLPGGDPSLFALVGMGAMMGGTMRSPLTAIVFVLELTHDLDVLPALLVGTVAALCVTVLWMRRSILTEKLARRGRHITREYGIDPFEQAIVADVMDRDVPTVQASTSVGDVSARIASGDAALARRRAAFVVDERGNLVGVLTRGDIVRALESDPSGRTPVADAGSTDPAVAFADSTVHEAMTTMMRRDVGRLPVVDRANPTRLIGYLGRAEILAVHLKQHTEEEARERGPLWTARAEPSKVS
jgi:chloride channel protein, CIC family